MDILIVSATSLELPLLGEFVESGTRNNNSFEWLVTGVGQTATTYALMKQLSRRKPDFVIQAGIAGSYAVTCPPGSAVLISDEVFADLGATENGQLLNLFDLNLADPNRRPFTSGFLHNDTDLSRIGSSLKLVKAATVNAISSSRADAERITDKYGVMIESMEGAAFHYVCLQENIPFVQLRTISNFAGERDKSNWKLKEAIEVLNRELIRILSSFNH